MKHARLIIKIRHEVDGKIKLDVGPMLFLAWNLNRGTTHVKWTDVLVNLEDVTDLCFYAARLSKKTAFISKDLWIEGIKDLQAKFKEGKML